MPETSPAFFQGDKRPRWRTLLVGSWLWIRLKFRQSPGFATATIAGTLGLVLCLAMLLNGGTAKWFGGQTVAEEEVDGGEPGTSLGEAEVEEAATNVVAANDDLSYERLVATSKTAVKTPGSKEESADDENPFDSELFSRPVVEQRPIRRNPLLEEPPETKTPAEEPELEFAAPTKSGRNAITLPEEVADEPASSGNEPEPDDNASFLTAVRPARDAGEEAKPDDAKAEADDAVAEPLVADRKPAKRDRSSLLFLDDEPKAEEPAEPAAAETEEPAASIKPVMADDAEPLAPVEPTEKTEPVADEPAATDESDIVPRSPPGWKNAPQTPARRRPAPPMPWAERSDEVQTTIHAAPAPVAEPEYPAASQIEPAAAQVRAAPTPVRIEVRSLPRSASGRTYELEIVVINLADAPLNDAYLSITLPAGLQHSLGAEIERPLGMLRGRELRRARLTVQAVAEGPFVVQAEVAARGRVAGKLSTTVGTKTAATSLSRTAADCYCAPVR